MCNRGVLSRQISIVLCVCVIRQHNAAFLRRTFSVWLHSHSVFDWRAFRQFVLTVCEVFLETHFMTSCWVVTFCECWSKFCTQTKVYRVATNLEKLGNLKVVRENRKMSANQLAMNGAENLKAELWFADVCKGVGHFPPGQFPPILGHFPPVPPKSRYAGLVIYRAARSSPI